MVIVDRIELWKLSKICTPWEESRERNHRVLVVDDVARDH